MLTTPTYFIITFYLSEDINIQSYEENNKKSDFVIG